MSVCKKEFQFGNQIIAMETGKIARQADGAVRISMGDTVLLVTCVVEKEADPSKGFLPLTVDYQERTYAAGRIPGGFFKREGRPSEKEVLTSRLIDRSLRPLFPKGFTHTIQIIATVLSIDPDIDPDIPALIGSATAVALSGVPFNGPLGAARVGYQDGQYLLNPSFKVLEDSTLDLVVAGTRSSVLMVESEAKQLSEQVMLDAVMFGHQQLQVVLDNIEAMVNEVGRQAWSWQPPEKSEDLLRLEADIKECCAAQIAEAYTIHDKLERKDRLDTVRKQLIETLTKEADATCLEGEIVETFKSLEKTIVRGSILEGERRIDGRERDVVRDISIEIGVLPRTHGSTLFTRGETQALVVTTLGTDRDGQIIDAIEGERKEFFMLHYNFPPFCVGETGRVGSPKRREIGHGRLAKRAILAVMPNMEEYPYSIRVVSEITESNGSSSMASVCGTSLSLMDAGVAIEAPVAGIAMGLVKEGDNYVVLSDIMGDEDHLGDMDFKVAGTDKGITALQMDIKIDGITKDIMEAALAQAKDGRIHILSKMNAIIAVHKQEMSEFAPRITVITIHPDKIRDVIGKGGSVIRSITEETGTTIDIDDLGNIKIAAIDRASGEAAKKRIEQITADIEVGKVYNGRVAKLMDFGAFVNILPGKDGLVHISQISDERVENVSDKLSEGDYVKVKVLEIDRQGRVRLSMKAVD